MKTIAIALTALLLTGAAHAGTVIDEIARDLWAQGFTHIELKAGSRRIEAEAVRGDETLEITYDAVTGEELSRESGASDDDEMGRTGDDVSGSADDDRDESGDTEEGDDEDGNDGEDDSDEDADDD